MAVIMQNSSLTTRIDAITTLHIALEYGAAILGGLGSVTTQMVEAQNKFSVEGHAAFNASIITPYYPKIYKDFEDLQPIACIAHLYNDQIVRSNIYLQQHDGNSHYMVDPVGVHKIMFDLGTPNEIYNTNATSTFIDRLKYFNSAVAAYISKATGSNHPKPEVIILHDWQAALIPKLLKEVHHTTSIKSIFIVHVSNIDFGGYSSHVLQGIGIKFAPGTHMLKAIGLKESDSIVAVSSHFLEECITHKQSDRQLEYLRKLFVLAATNGNKVVAILNGFNFARFCPIGTLIADKSDIVLSKKVIKNNLIKQLMQAHSNWHINPELPIVFFVGRFSPEKGVETFAQLIKIIKNRAIFVAIGRGLTESVALVMDAHSKKTSNIFISNSEEDQKRFGAMMRAGADWTYIPSHREACGLVSMESFANGAPCITSGVGGLQDSVKQLEYRDLDNVTGNAVIYHDHNEKSENPALSKAVDGALLLWSSLSLKQKNVLHLRLIDEARQYDWLAQDGALSKYLKVCKKFRSA
jgi:glycogen synthase